MGGVHVNKQKDGKPGTWAERPTRFSGVVKSVPLSREHGPVEYYYEAVHLTAQTAFPCPKTISQLSIIHQYTVPNLVIYPIYQEPNKGIRTNYFSSVFKYLIIITALPKFYILRLINLKISQTF